jgi:hypothetical protein
LPTVQFAGIFTLEAAFASKDASTIQINGNANIIARTTRTIYGAIFFNFVFFISNTS